MGLIATISDTIGTAFGTQLTPSPTDDFWYRPVGRMSSAGVDVDEETALNYSAVWAATCVISETMAALPFSMMEQVGPKTVEVAYGEMLHDIVGNEPNPEQDSMLFRDMQFGQQLNWGNCFAEKEMLGNRVVNLWPIHASRIPKQNIKRNGRGEIYVGQPGELVYHVKNNDGTATPIPASRMLHITGRRPDDGIFGRSVIRCAKDSIGLGIATEQFGGKFFSNGALPRIILRHPGRLSDAAYNHLREQWSGGLSNSHETKIAEEGVEIEKLTIEPEAAQFLGTRQFNVKEIARWYRIPPHMLGDLDRAIQSNIEEEAISLVKYSFMPWAVRWEKAMRRQLLTPEQKRRFYFKFNFNGLLRGDAKTRAEFYNKLLTSAVFSINDVRALEDMNPVEGGDNRFIQVNMQTLERAAEWDPMAEKTPPQDNSEEMRTRFTELKSLMTDLVDSANERDNRVEQALVTLDLASNDDLDWFKRQMIDKLAEFKPHANGQDRESAMRAAEAMRDAALQRIRTMHRTAAMRAAKDPKKFLEWNDSFGPKNRDKFVAELKPVAEVYAKLGEVLHVSEIVGEHIDGMHRKLLDASGEATADNLADVVSGIFGETE